MEVSQYLLVLSWPEINVFFFLLTVDKMPIQKKINQVNEEVMKILFLVKKIK
jgi:hypothetical protein